MLRLQSAVKFKPVRRGVPNIVSTTHSLLVRTKGKCLPTEPTKRYAGESVPGAVITHVCLGSVYASSLMNEPLARELGVILPASGDWNLNYVVTMFSIILGMHGISAALLGKWQEGVGPRVSGVLGAFAFGGGMVVGGLGVYFHQLWMLYLGYGVLAGLGMGLAYVPPVATLIRWFPDRRGLATGLTIMGFGGGAFVCTPLINKLFHAFQQAPTYLGKLGDVQLVTEQGRRYAKIVTDGVEQLREVIVASPKELASSGFHGLEEGVYLVGTGSTGSFETLVVTGGLFFVGMLASALSFKIPYPGYSPEGWKPPPPAAGSSVSGNSYVHIDNVMKTPQFWQLWATFCCVATAGMGVLAMAKTMMREIFSANLPHLVTGNFAATYIMALSVGNLIGRLLWAALSDKIGPKKTFALFTLVSIPLYAMIPFCVEALTKDPSVTPLALFYVSTFFIVSFFGGAYAVCPPFESELFGSRFVGAVHGRMLTASAVAAIFGPMVTAYLRKKSEIAAIKDLCAQVDPTAFLNKFGASLSEIDTLISTKTVSIQKLLEILPSGTLDPTPLIYNTSLYGAVGLVVVAAIINLSIRPVNEKYFTKDVFPAGTHSHLTESSPKWMIAVNGTHVADDVFFWTLAALKKQTSIQKLVVVIVDPPAVTGTKAMQPFLPMNDGDPHFASSRLLSKYVAVAKQVGVSVIPLLITSAHVGEGIAAAASVHKPEMIVLPAEHKKEHPLGAYLAEKTKCKVEVVEFDADVPEKDTLKQEAEKAQIQAHLYELLHPVDHTHHTENLVIYEKKSKN